MNFFYSLIFTFFLLTFHSFYGMSPLMIEGMSDYQARKAAVVPYPPAEREEISVNIFLQKVTSDTLILTSEYLNFHLHCPPEMHEAERQKLLLEPHTKIFFSDTPTLDGNGIVSNVLDCRGIAHIIKNRDMHLFFYDYYSPTIYTQLIPKEVVAKDRICIIAFLAVLNNLKKNGTLKFDLRIVRETIIPRLCVNIKDHLYNHWKNISRSPDEKSEEDNSFLGDFFKNKHVIFKAKAQLLLNNFNFAMVEAIMKHYCFNLIADTKE